VQAQCDCPTLQSSDSVIAPFNARAGELRSFNQRASVAFRELGVLKITLIFLLHSVPNFDENE
jgi:hypothetical protein